MERKKLPGFLAISVIVAAVGAVGVGLHAAGLVSLSAIAEAVFDAFLGGASVAIGALLVVMYPQSRLVRLFLKKDQDREPEPPPRLKVDPLPHLKGWMVPTGRKEDWKLYQGEEPRLSPKPSWGRPTSPERTGHGIHLSQVIELVWLDRAFHPDGKIQTEPVEEGRRGEVHLKFIALKFGVLSITNQGGEAERCRADGWYRLKGDARWNKIGALSWFSDTKQLALRQDKEKMEAMSKNPIEPIDDVLGVEFADIPKGATKSDECDLLLFFMRGTLPHVYILGAGWTRVAGDATPESALRFDMKVRFKARGMVSIQKAYRVVVKPDDFRIREIEFQ